MQIASSQVHRHQLFHVAESTHSDEDVTEGSAKDDNKIHYYDFEYFIFIATDGDVIIFI